MSKVLGPLSYENGHQQNFLGKNGTNPRRMVSDETAKAIDDEVKEIVEAGYQQALAILNNNRDLLEAIAQRLLETEVIEGKELENLLNQVRNS